MLKGKFISLLVAACVAALPFFTAWSFASEADDKRAELNEVQSQMQKMQERKEKARQKAEAATEGLEEIQTSLNRLRVQARDLQGKSDALQAKINENQAKLAQKKAEVAQRKKIYSKRLRQIYINGQINYLDVLLGAKDFGDFSSRMYLLQKIISSDIEMLTQLQKAEAEVKSRQEQLDAEMKEIKSTQAELEAKRAQANRLKEQRSYWIRLRRKSARARASTNVFWLLARTSLRCCAIWKVAVAQAPAAVAQVVLSGPAAVKSPPTSVGVPIPFSVPLNTTAVWISQWIMVLLFWRPILAPSFIAAGWVAMVMR